MVTLLEGRYARWLAWFLVMLYAVLMTAGLTLHVVTRSPILGVSLPAEFFEAAVLSIWAVVGALIISRHPLHPVGWLWCLLPLLVALDNVAWGYAYYGTLANPGSLPGVEIAIVWLYMLLGRGVLGPLCMALLFLLFPTGRLPSKRWSILAWTAIGAAVMNILASALAPNPIGYFPFPKDIFSLNSRILTFLKPLGTITFTILTFCLVAAAFSLFFRLFRATGEERQQLKWFVYSTFFLALGFLLTNQVLSRQNPGLDSTFIISAVILLFGFAGVAIASAIAIFRYRLWDIDIIIRRTLIYGALTITLGVIFFGGVVGLQGIFGVLTGTEGDALSIIVSTLAIAALFNTLRKKIQDIIDRSFYRRKYNTEKVVEGFAGIVRDEVGLDEISASLLLVVEDTMQPKSVSLWLKE